MLPDEEFAKVAVNDECGDLLRLTAAFHDFAVAPLLPSSPVVTSNMRGITQLVKYTSLGLYVRALKEHRAVQLLAEHGLGENALAVSRHLLETTLALLFVLRHRVTLKRQGRRLPPVPGFPLTAHFRALLYLAHATALESERTLAQFQRTPRVKRYSSVASRKRLASGLADVEKAIGKEWLSRLKATKSYSGLRLPDLTASLGMRVAYALAYKRASWAVHPTQLGRYIKAGTATEPGELHLTPAPTDVGRALDTANTYLTICLTLLDTRFGLGLAADMRRHGSALGAVARAW